jgi:hypothetical protein
MPSFFIIAFIWRGLIFPGSIFLTTLPYSYRYSIIKCKHLRSRNDRSAACYEPVVPGNHQHVITRADSGICGYDVFCKRIFSQSNEFCHIIPDHDPVSRGREYSLKPLCSPDAEGEPAIGCPDGCQPGSLIQYLTDPPGG